MDERLIDELLTGISDNLTNEIDLFLIDNVDGKDIKRKIIIFINEAYIQGLDAGMAFVDKELLEDDGTQFGIGDEAVQKMRSDFEKKHEEFTKEFEKNLLDGQDKPVSE